MKHDDPTGIRRFLVDFWDPPPNLSVGKPRSGKSALANWFDMVKPLGFMYGTPIGIVAAALTIPAVKLFDFWGGTDEGAKAVVVGFITGVVLGGAWAAIDALTRFKWVSEEVPSQLKWEELIRTLNAAAARDHYLMSQRQDGYVVYSPTLATPVAGGPLTVTGEYLSIVVAQKACSTDVEITGPRKIVKRLKLAVLATPLSMRDAVTVGREHEARQLLEEKVANLRRMSYPELRSLPGFFPKVSIVDRLRARLGGERLRIVDGDPREIEEIDGPLGNPYHVVTSPHLQEDGRIHVAVLVNDAGFFEAKLPILRADLFFSPDGSVERTLLHFDDDEE